MPENQCSFTFGSEPDRAIWNVDCINVQFQALKTVKIALDIQHVRRRSSGRAPRVGTTGRAIAATTTLAATGEGVGEVAREAAVLECVGVGVP